MFLTLTYPTSVSMIIILFKTPKKWMDYSNRNNYKVCAAHLKAEKKNIVEKDGFSSCHERGTKKKF